ncbi:hypothetical protein BY996DRAFT_6484948 [Phakopsora pachyrhizi]|uniref:Uncharacterized protein n=1 Tax=Phakopsora pachyrhizi TaxID=170000 RepID=A0AAV0AVA8_PHAPC|nr:hypothetical protein BY996DRAFT_6484948 [Phakopsora pachyrhizi]CAH7673604.1 hypothetical protein PPACK8108_LOCUS8477 [Phakopsora pachyrhizi]
MAGLPGEQVNKANQLKFALEASWPGEQFNKGNHNKFALEAGCPLEQRALGKHETQGFSSFEEAQVKAPNIDERLRVKSKGRVDRCGEQNCTGAHCIKNSSIFTQGIQSINNHLKAHGMTPMCLPNYQQQGSSS